MKLTSGQMKITENKAKNKFFKDVQVGDIVEVEMDLSKRLTYNGGSKMVTVKNLTSGTSRTDAPVHLNSGFEKMKWRDAHPTGAAEVKRLEDALAACQMYAKSMQDKGHRGIQEVGFILEEIEKALGKK